MEFVFVEDVIQPSAFMDFHVVLMLSQHLDEFPDLSNTLLCAGLEPEDGPASGKILRWMWQIVIEPVKDFSYVLPLVPRKVTRIEESIRCY